MMKKQVLRPVRGPPDPRSLGSSNVFDVEAVLEAPVKASVVEFASLEPAWARCRQVLEARKAERGAADAKKRKHEQDEAERKRQRMYRFEQIVVAPAVSDRPALDAELARLAMRSATPVEGQAEVRSRIGALREAEWREYEGSCRNQGLAEPRKGEWRDAAFFDFMSWVLHTALAEKLAPETAKDHDDRVGDAIARHLELTVSSRENLVADLKRALDRLLTLGYAARGRLVENYNDTDAIRCDLALPANLWSGAALDRAKAPFKNDLHLLAFSSALRSFNLTLTDVQRKASSDGKVAHIFRLVPLS